MKLTQSQLDEMWRRGVVSPGEIRSLLCYIEKELPAGGAVSSRREIPRSMRTVRASTLYGGQNVPRDY